MFGVPVSLLGGAVPLIPTNGPERIVCPAIVKNCANRAESLTTRHTGRAVTIPMQVAPLTLSRPSPACPSAGWTVHVWSLGMISGWAEAGVAKRVAATKSIAKKPGTTAPVRQDHNCFNTATLRPINLWQNYPVLWRTSQAGTPSAPLPVDQPDQRQERNERNPAPGPYR